MAAESDSSQISDNFSNLKINTDSANNVSSVNSPVDTSKYGLPLKEVYRLAYNFYKGIS